jgi:hypothetical protein
MRKDEVEAVRIGCGLNLGGTSVVTSEISLKASLDGDMIGKTATASFCHPSYSSLSKRLYISYAGIVEAIKS